MFCNAWSIVANSHWPDGLNVMESVRASKDLIPPNVHQYARRDRGEQPPRYGGHGEG